ncbi:3-oxoacyl-[acyl-carrier-protein] synthase 3 [Chlamydiales bacterium SCGC AB-751-O23]|jgi:3-oxoacyl-[acyl-carrier-protein] synthase III|nr:3-oxoacyl-[acyl-carrier-protein] synthase 3 [Chlamydiales bacterium SCGC AB-751-O23]
MAEIRESYILSTGSYLPEKVLSNKDLESIVETSEDWILSRTGIEERRIAAENEFTSDMAAAAAKDALEKAKKNIEDIDLILVATSTPDYMCPSAASIIQEKLGADSIPAMDVNAACTGYVYGLSMAKAFVESGSYDNILLIASEKLSFIVDYEDRTTCILFGDGAGASIISSKGPGLKIKSINLGADGKQAGILGVEAGGCKVPASKESVENKKHFLKMNGREVFKHAVRRMAKCVQDVCAKEGITDTDIDYLVPHQANIRILDALTERFNMPKEKVFKTVNKYGNTSASSIIIALDEMLKEKQPKDGENVILVAFGAGLTWGSCLLTVSQ